MWTIRGALGGARSSVVLFGAALAAGCLSVPGYHDPDGSTDTDTDADSDTDTGTDTGTDTSTDTGADTDTDTDTDTGTDADTDTDTETGSDTGDTDTELECAGGRLDLVTNLCWQDPMAAEMTWQDAVDYCDGLDTAGHTDWVLPSRDDFVTLLGACDADVSSGGTGYCDSCAASDSCGALFGSDAGWYWSSSPAETDYAWVAFFDSGYVVGYLATLDFNVRCVHPGS
jgi:hypothetical protein